MKTNLLTIASIALLLVTAIGSTLVRPALALVEDATSTETVSASSTAIERIEAVSASTTEEGTVQEVTPLASTTTEAQISPAGATYAPLSFQVEPIEAAPVGLTEVHVIGIKYSDYFTDGTTEFSFPGDPAVGAHLAEPDAPTPTHDGMTWVHTTSQYLYDTPSGDLEEGQYAVQLTGTTISHPFPFVASTSTSPESEATAPVFDPSWTVISTSSEPTPESVPDQSVTDESSTTAVSDFQPVDAITDLSQGASTTFLESYGESTSSNSI